MTINDRDRAVLDFIEKCPSNSAIIHDLFFPSLFTCQRRLQKLYEEKLLKRYRSHVGEGFIYYLDKKPRQVEHTLYVSKLYAHWLSGGYTVLTFKREIVLNKIRPDAIAVVKSKDGIKTYLVEVEISNNSLSKKLKAYENFYMNDAIDLLGCKPTLLLVSNKRIPEGITFDYEVMRLDHI